MQIIKITNLSDESLSAFQIQQGKVINSLTISYYLQVSQSSKVYSFTCRTLCLERESISFLDSDVFSFLKVNLPSFFSKSGHVLGYLLCFSDVSDKYTASVFRVTELFKVNVDVMGWKKIRSP